VDLRILPLDKEHDRKSFHCGEPSLDERGSAQDEE
jgi:hypothetical protein